MSLLHVTIAFATVLLAYCSHEAGGTTAPAGISARAVTPALAATLVPLQTAYFSFENRSDEQQQPTPTANFTVLTVPDEIAQPGLLQHNSLNLFHSKRVRLFIF